METKKAAKPGYTNPAFKAMGLPTLRLPSRNWTIFWTILTASVGGIVYDKYQQKQIRNRFREVVEPLSQQQIGVERLPRKVTVFIAPPPSDYLDTSLKVWKRYIKPILYWGGLDYEIVEADTQGVIRHEVAKRIREVRKQLLETQSTVGKRASTSNKRNAQLTEEGDEAFDPEQAKKFKEEFDYSNALGVFRQWNIPQIVHEDALVGDPALSGGVICLGRGAYKEYINGLHEGILGPLEAPEESQESQQALQEPKDISEGATKIATLQDVSNTDVSPDAKDASASQDAKDMGASPDAKDMGASPDAKDQNDQESVETNETAGTSAKQIVPKPYITSENYANVEYPSELQGIVKDPKTKVPIWPHQSILAIHIPNLIGFLCIPERIYRFYTRRYYAEEVMSAVTDLVLQQRVRPFENPKDLDLCKEEELDWPKRWVQRGLDRNSEWTSQLRDDPRVAEQLHVYNETRQDEEV